MNNNTNNNMLEKILTVVLAWFPDVELDSYVIEANAGGYMTIKLANNYCLSFPITYLEMPVEELVEMYMGIKKKMEQRDEARRLEIEETNRQLEISRNRENARINFLLSEEGSKLCKPLDGEPKHDTFERIGDYLAANGMMLPQESDRLKTDTEAKRNGTYVPGSVGEAGTNSKVDNEVSNITLK